MFRVTAVLLAIIALAASEPVDYTGHKVLRTIPKSHEELELIHRLHTDYGVDLWNDPRIVGKPVLFRLEPKLVQAVEDTLKKKSIEYDVVYHDLQRIITGERAMCAQSNGSQAPPRINFGTYNTYDTIYSFILGLAQSYPSIARLERIGSSYENRPIQNLRISSDLSGTKPAIMIECGIHAREWSSVAAGVYLVNQLITTYDSDSTVKSLLDKYEFNVIVESNPDGYIYTWNQDRLWRKTRSRSSIDWLGNCRGADANRNFDIEHCGVGTSRRPCDETYCGDKPFSEGESRALRDLMIKLGNRLKAYFSVHAYSQLWMTPYGTTKKLPPHYDEMIRVAQAGTTALAKRYGTQYTVGSIANVIYEAAGSSVDYAYVKLNVTIAYALELRDNGRYGFFLPANLILPMCEETFDGIVGAVQALK